MRALNIASATSLSIMAMLAPAISQTLKNAPSTGHPTQSVTVTGSGFANDEAVDVYIDLTDTVLLVSSSTGTFSGTVEIPASAAPGAHYITAIGRKSGDAAQAGFTVTTPWVEEGYGAAHLVLNPYENTIGPANANQLGLLWASSVLSEGGTPAIYAGVAYFNGSPGVTAISTSTGATLWNVQTSANFFGSPALYGGYIYIGSSTGALYSLSASNGAVHWSATLGSTIFSSPVIAKGILYTGCNDDHVYALNASTGATLWTYATGGAIDGSAAVVNGVVYIGSEDDSMYALNAASGALIWSYKTGGEVESTPAVAGGVVYFGSDDGKVYAVKEAGPHAGSLLWSYTTNSDVFASPAVAEGVVYIGSLDGNLYALNAHTGALIWSVTTGGLVRSPAVANGVVYATSEDDSLYVLNAATGAILGTSVTGANYFGNPVISDGVVYVAELGGPVYAFAPQAGTAAVPPLAHAPNPASLHPNRDLVVTK